MDDKKYSNYMLVIVTFLIMVCILSNLRIAVDGPFERPPSTTKTEYTQISLDMRNKIPVVLREVRNNVKDLNRDGLVNCIDYAVSFWSTWTRKFPNRCELIRNYNPDYNYYGETTKWVRECGGVY